jgi:hypothetical protein
VRAVTAALVAVVTLAAAGCGGGEDRSAGAAATTTAPSTTTTAAAPTTSAPTATTAAPAPAEGGTPEERYVAAVDAQGLRVDGVVERSDEDLVTEATWVCAATPLGVAPTASSKGLTPAEYLISQSVLDATSTYGRRVVLAIEMLCPENQQYLDQARSPDPPTMPPLTEFRDGHYVVGDDVEPGLYETAHPVDECRWTRLDAAAHAIEDGVVLDQRRTEVTIAAEDAFFDSQGCGLWQKVG